MNPQPSPWRAPRLALRALALLWLLLLAGWLLSTEVQARNSGTLASMGHASGATGAA